jgi:hypothetical protein
MKTLADRKPRNSSLNFHEAADEWFLDRFGLRYRSQAVFVTASMLMAASYAVSDGVVARIVPISEYRYCWSPRVSDLLFIAKDMANASKKDIWSELDTCQYKDNDLRLAADSGHELMLACAEYVALPVTVLAIRSKSESKIILP